MDKHWTPDTNKSPQASEPLGNARVEAARKRLRECRDQKEVCEAIREIVANLVGCEEMALFKLIRKEARFELAWSFGVEFHDLHVPEVVCGSALPSLVAGEVYTAEASGGAKVISTGGRTSAILPIQLRGETVAALVLLRLLRQKAKIEGHDREVFAVISKEAGNLLFAGSASDSARRGAKS